MLHKTFVAMILYLNHSFTIKLFNALPYLSIFLTMISILKTFTPMAEIATYDEECARIVEIRHKYLTVAFSHFFINGSTEYRDYFDCPS